MRYQLIVAPIILCFPALVSSSGTKADFYVSPAGDDCWSGTLPAADAGRRDGPFKTLAGARDAVRGRLADMDADVVVMLRGGRYSLDKTVVFGLADCGKGDCKVVYKNYPGEEPILTSGVRITGWKKVNQVFPGLPAKAQGRIWVAEMPVGLPRFFTLYDGETRLPRARGDGFAPTKELDDPQVSRTALYFPSGALKNWANLPGAEIVIIPTYPWTMNILPLASVDEAGGVAKMAGPATYPLCRLRWPVRSGKDRNVWVENVFEALDSPSEWVLDSAAGRLYLWPPGPTPSDQIVAPSLTELLRIEGRIDYQGPSDTPVRNLVFRGLTFTQGDRFEWEEDRAGRGLQHDWEIFDRPTALLRLRGAEGCAIEACRFTNSGGSAVRLDLHCQRNRIAGNTIHHIGGVGILLAGYGPGTKDVNKHNQILNNHIHHVGQIHWHSVGIFAWQSGENRIANNLIHHTPYTGIVVSGRIGWDRSGRAECSKTIRWHEVDRVAGGKRGPLTWEQREPFLHGRKNVIERNEIHQVMEVLADGNGIYVSGTGAGNLVRRNYLHDNTSPTMAAAIRCDDDQHQTTIEGNIIHRNRGMAGGMAIKGVNHIVNNIIADLHTDAHHRGYISLEVNSPAGAIVQRNILYSQDKTQRVYHGHRLYNTKGPDPQLRECQADYNLYYNTADPQWGDRHLQQERPFGIETHSLSADPLFVDLDNGDFRLKPESPALTLGFEQIEVSKIGLTGGFSAGFTVPARQRQLFLDDYGIARIENLKPTMHQPVKRGAVIVPDRPWEKELQTRSVPAWDERERIWRFWLSTITGNPRTAAGPTYVESTDGLNWTRPILRQYEFQGSFDNNFIAVDPTLQWPANAIQNVVYDPEDPDPSRRYKGLAHCRGREPIVSPDGIRWRRLKVPRIPSQDESNLSYDRLTRTFIATLKKQRRAYGRAVTLSTSKDFEKWTEPELIFRADAEDQRRAKAKIRARLSNPKLQQPVYNDPAYYQADIYNMAIFRYEGLYIGLPAVYYTTGPRPEGNTDGFHEIQLACSRDLHTWQRLGGRQPFIDTSPVGQNAWDTMCLLPPSAPVVRGDELWFYYSGEKYRARPPGAGPLRGTVFLAILRRDGFISLDAGKGEGTILTKPFTVRGRKLFVNVNARPDLDRASQGGKSDTKLAVALRGVLRAELLDQDGKVVAVSAPIGDDHRRAQVSWENGDIADLEGKTVSLCFRLRNASLYSYWVE